MLKNGRHMDATLKVIYRKYDNYITFIRKSENSSDFNGKEVAI